MSELLIVRMWRPKRRVFLWRNSGGSVTAEAATALMKICSDEQ
jgi:hypothetical protein